MDNKSKEIINFFVILCIYSVSFAQTDSILSNNIQSKGKTSYGGIPIVSYDADIGLRYGGVINYFKYNDSLSKKYSENLFFRIFNTTKKSFQIQSVYETDNLIKNSKTVIEATYLNDKSYDFYGYNGNQTRYNTTFEDPNDKDYIHEDFYSINRELIRFRFDFQRYLTSSKLRLLTGITISKFNISQQPSDNNLYSKYSMMDIVPKHEQKGGFANYLIVGIVYDNRNNQCYCSEGKWFESFFILSSKQLSSIGFSKYILSYRSYNKIGKTKFVVMSRSSLQLKTSGTIPSYLKTTYFDTKLNQDGLGGGFNLRGYNRNRITADGFGLINLEIRKNLWNFNSKKMSIDFDISFFTDNAFIIQEQLINKEKIPVEYQTKLFDFNSKRYYSSAGVGGYIILNKNSVISLNYGFPINHKESKGGAIYIGSSFLF